MAFKNPIDLAQNFEKTQKLSGATSPQLAGHRHGVLDPRNVGDNASYHWHRSFKSPKELIGKIQEDNKYFDNLKNVKDPLEEFTNYEAANFYGAMWDNDRRFFGIKEPQSITYPQLLESYKNSKGNFAKNIDPRVQKYFDDQMAKRQNILDRFKKVPEKESEAFQIGLGHKLDPFDFEEEDFVPEDIYNNGSTLLDYDPYSWDTIQEYLTEKGY